MILTTGCFDGLHAGHRAFLTKAAAHRKHAEKLRVLVDPADYIRETKGREPHQTDEARVKALLDLACVDEATIRHDALADEIRTNPPRLFIKGIDWQGKLPAEIEAACTDAGAQIIYVDSGSTEHTADAVDATPPKPHKARPKSTSTKRHAPRKK